MLESRDVNILLDTVPALPLRRLRKGLEEIAAEQKMGPSTGSLAHFDSAFDLKPGASMVS